VKRGGAIAVICFVTSFAACSDDAPPPIACGELRQLRADLATADEMLSVSPTPRPPEMHGAAAVLTSARLHPAGHAAELRDTARRLVRGSDFAASVVHDDLHMLQTAAGLSEINAVRDEYFPPIKAVSHLLIGVDGELAASCG
jgi:hypothetical protein